MNIAKINTVYKSVFEFIDKQLMVSIFGLTDIKELNRKPTPANIPEVAGETPEQAKWPHCDINTLRDS